MAPAGEQDEESKDFGRLVNPELAGRLRKMGIVAPNTIQEDAVQLALSGRDIMVVAQTGSGKTLTYLLPILQRLSEDHSSTGACQGPGALVLAPTDQLAEQVARVATELAEALRSRPQVGLLQSGHEGSTGTLPLHLAIGTPDEALRCWQQGLITAHQLRMLAIDETDAILCSAGDLAQQVDSFVRELEAGTQPPQLFLAMAHLTEVRENELLSRFPTVQHVRHTGVMVPTLRQCYHYFRDDKEDKLLSILGRSSEDAWLSAGTTLVFCSKPETARQVHGFLDEKLQSKPVALHDGMKAEERAASSTAFREGVSSVLITTDSAARGLDFPLLRHVILYDVPSDITAFVHCAGRTARRGKQGLVTCLVQTHEASLFQFDFKGHHGLQPAAQLQFRPSKDVQDLPELKAGVQLVKSVEPTSRRSKESPGQQKAKKTDGKLAAKERRRDPADGKAYSLQELQGFYARQYSKAEILAYWQRECTPLGAKSC